MVRLILFEYRKNFFKISIVIVILAFSILNVIKIASVYSENSLFGHCQDVKSSAVWRGVYNKFYKTLGGMITVDKIQKMLAVYNKAESKVSDRTVSTSENTPGTYTGNYYEDDSLISRGFYSPMKYDYEYKGYSDSIVQSAIKNMYFYNHFGNTYEYNKNSAIAGIFAGRSIKSFSNTEMYNYYTDYGFSSLLVLLVCLYGIVGVFAYEKETDMDMLLLSAKYGSGRTTAAKVISSAAFIILACLWFFLLDFIAFGFVFSSFDGGFEPLYAIDNFSNTPLNLNLIQYSLLSAAVKTTGMLVLGMGVLLLSCRFRRVLIPFVISLPAAMLLYYAQWMFSVSSNIALKALNPFALLVNKDIFRKTEFADLFGIAVPGYALALTFGAAVGVLFLIGIAVFARKSTVFRRTAQ